MQYSNNFLLAFHGLSLLILYVFFVNGLELIEQRPNVVSHLIF